MTLARKTNCFDLDNVVCMDGKSLFFKKNWSKYLERKLK